MRKEYIKKLNTYKELLIECKRVKIIEYIENEVENKIPITGKAKQKILTLNR